MARKTTAAKIHHPKSAAEARAIVEERRPYCNAISEAFMRGDMQGVADAQRVMRDAFPEG
jgi:hypothetical protein